MLVNKKAWSSAWRLDSSSPAHMARTVPSTPMAGWSAMAWAAHPVRSRNSSAGVTSDTRPTWWARAAEIRSLAPRSDMRMTSWNGILWSMKMGSKAAGIP